jgi:hypothetical protein
MATEYIRQTVYTFVADDGGAVFSLNAEPATTNGSSAERRAVMQVPRANAACISDPDLPTLLQGFSSD